MSSNPQDWNGKVLPYRPVVDLRLADYVHLHSDAHERLDPIDFEVIRHAMWNVNEEHSLAIITVSPSPIAAIVHDLNCALLTEQAEYVYFAPYLQHLNAAADSAIKWTCQHRAPDMGVADGDVFVTDDPWIGSNHQQDICMYAPVIVDGRIFAWVTNSLHHYDLGGTTPGSFCPDAQSVFVEPTPFPPMKLVDQGRLRTDVEHSITRRSRMPQIVGLDLRSQLAGINVARTRLQSLIDTYGPETVKGVMNKIIGDSETAFVDKLRQIPDGTWNERVFQECAFVGDRGVYPVQLNVTKHGDELIFTNDGTDPAIGALNTGYVGWKGGITAGIIPLLTYDQHFAIGGGLRHVRFEPVPNTITCASWPAPMSAGPSTAVHLTMKQTTQALNRMLLTAPELQAKVLCWGSVAQWPLMSVEGLDRNGEYYGSSILEPMIGGTGARREADGVDAGGHTWDPKSSGANAEENELFFPLLYLSRSELPDSGAAGQYRGGNTVVTRFVPHRTGGINHSLTSSSQESPATSSVSGASPGAPNRVRLARDSKVLQLMADGTMPTTFDEVGGTIELVPTKARNFFQNRTDVYEFIYTGGTGLGDPLRREPQAVADDVSDCSTSPEAARSLYHVEVERVDDYFWTVDEAKTESLRRETLAQRLELPIFAGGEPQGGSVHPSVPSTQLLLSLRQAVVDGTAVTFCGDCRTVMAPTAQNYKSHCRFEELPLNETNPYFLDGPTFIDVEFVLRRYFCPSCGALFDTEICRAGTEPFRDVTLSE